MKKKIIIAFIAIIAVILIGWLNWPYLSAPSPAKKTSQEILSGLGVPTEAILIDYSRADVNQDKKIETLVVADDPIMKNSLVYIVDETGRRVYQREILVTPVRIELRRFEKDKYLSFFLAFDNQYKEGYFIRWNGGEYEIPDEER